MKVKQAIKLLQKLPQELEIVTNGHCDGFRESVIIKKCYLQRDVNKGSCVYGEHGRYLHAESIFRKNKHTDMMAVLIGSIDHTHSSA